MNWLPALLLAIQQMSPIEATLLTIMAIFFLYRGGINLIIPAIKKSKNKKEEEPITNPDNLIEIHKPCQNYGSFRVILERAMKDSADIIRIRYIETIYDQMNLAEETWRRIRVDLRQAFVENLEKDLPVTKKQEAKICYNLVLDKIGTGLIGLMRKWVKRNHFTSKGEIEFQAYIKERVQDLEEYFSIAIQDVYVPSKMQVDLENLRKFNIEKVMPQIGEELNSFFIKARIISKEKEKEIERIKTVGYLNGD